MRLTANKRAAGIKETSGRHLDSVPSVPGVQDGVGILVDGNAKPSGLKHDGRIWRSGARHNRVANFRAMFSRPRDTSGLSSAIKRGQQSGGPRRVHVDSSSARCPACLGHLSQSMSVDDNLYRPVEAVEYSTGYNHNHGAIRSRALGLDAIRYVFGYVQVGCIARLWGRVISGRPTV